MESLLTVEELCGKLAKVVVEEGPAPSSSAAEATGIAPSSCRV